MNSGSSPKTSHIESRIHRGRLRGMNHFNASPPLLLYSLPPAPIVICTHPAASVGLISSTSAIRPRCSFPVLHIARPRSCPRRSGPDLSRLPASLGTFASARLRPWTRRLGGRIARLLGMLCGAKPLPRVPQSPFGLTRNIRGACVESPLSNQPTPRLCSLQNVVPRKFSQMAATMRSLSQSRPC